MMKKGDKVIVQKPLLEIKNILETGVLIEKIQRISEKNQSQLWKIKMDNGSVEQCEESYLMRK